MTLSLTKEGPLPLVKPRKESEQMERLLIGISTTLATAAILALASLYVQVQVMDNEIAHLQKQVEAVQRYVVANWGPRTP